MTEVYLTALTSILTALGTWYAARRKNIAESQANELDNVDKAVRYYREMVEDLGGRLKSATDELHKVTQLHREAIDELTEAHRQLKESWEQLDGVKSEMKSLEERFNLLADENRALIDELKKYKQLNGKA